MLFFIIICFDCILTKRCQIDYLLSVTSNRRQGAKNLFIISILFMQRTYLSKDLYCVGTKKFKEISNTYLHHYARLLLIRNCHKNLIRYERSWTIERRDFLFSIQLYLIYFKDWIIDCNHWLSNLCCIFGR